MFFTVQISPVVHQLDHFLDELISLADQYIHAPQAGRSANPSTANAPVHAFGSTLNAKYKPRSNDKVYVDRAWQALATSQCLFDCTDSVVF